ncbi:MAG: DUF1583 domain-containing protein [Planctomycetes bacterium]|nr:DUF1583 domain-containing protein [Planctomycetota bacterium]
MTTQRGVLNLRCRTERPKASRCWRIVWYGVLIAVAWSAAVRPAASADGSADRDKPIEKFEKNYRKAFKAGKMQFSGGGKAHGRQTSDGARLTIPPGTDAYCGVMAKFDVEGDFEITAGYTIESMPIPKGDSNTGLKLTVREVGEQQCATVGHWVSRAGWFFKASKSVMQESGKYKHDVRATPGVSTSGKLRLVRTGSTLQYLVAEAPGDEFVELRTLEFGPANLNRIDLAVQTGGSLQGIDVVFTDLDIQAENLSVHVGPPSNLLVHLLLIGVGVALVVLVAVGFLRWQKKRSKGQGGEVEAVQ